MEENNDVETYSAVPPKFQQYLTLELWRKLSLEERISCILMFDDPSIFFLNNCSFGKTSSKGDLSDSESELFWERIQRFNSLIGIDTMFTDDKYWGYFAIPFKNRTGSFLKNYFQYCSENNLIPISLRKPAIQQARASILFKLSNDLFEQDADKAIISLIQEKAKEFEEQPVNQDDNSEEKVQQKEPPQMFFTPQKPNIDFHNFSKNKISNPKFFTPKAQSHFDSHVQFNHQNPEQNNYNIQNQTFSFQSPNNFNPQFNYTKTNFNPQQNFGQSQSLYSLKNVKKEKEVIVLLDYSSDEESENDKPPPSSFSMPQYNYSNANNSLRPIENQFNESTILKTPSKNQFNIQKSNSNHEDNIHSNFENADEIILNQKESEPLINESNEKVNQFEQNNFSNKMKSTEQIIQSSPINSPQKVNQTPQINLHDLNQLQSIQSTQEINQTPQLNQFQQINSINQSPQINTIEQFNRYRPINSIENQSLQTMNQSQITNWQMNHFQQNSLPVQNRLQTKKLPKSNRSQQTNSKPYNILNLIDQINQSQQIAILPKASQSNSRENRLKRNSKLNQPINSQDLGHPIQNSRNLPKSKAINNSNSQTNYSTLPLYNTQSNRILLRLAQERNKSPRQQTINNQNNLYTNSDNPMINQTTQIVQQNQIGLNKQTQMNNYQNGLNKQNQIGYQIGLNKQNVERSKSNQISYSDTSNSIEPIRQFTPNSNSANEVNQQSKQNNERNEEIAYDDYFYDDYSYESSDDTSSEIPPYSTSSSESCLPNQSSENSPPRNRNDHSLFNETAQNHHIIFNENEFMQSHSINPNTQNSLTNANTQNNQNSLTNENIQNNETNENTQSIQNNEINREGVSNSPLDEQSNFLTGFESDSEPKTSPLAISPSDFQFTIKFNDFNNGFVNPSYLTDKESQQKAIQANQLVSNQNDYEHLKKAIQQIPESETTKINLFTGFVPSFKEISKNLNLESKETCKNIIKEHKKKMEEVETPSPPQTVVHRFSSIDVEQIRLKPELDIINYAENNEIEPSQSFESKIMGTLDYYYYERDSNFDINDPVLYFPSPNLNMSFPFQRSQEQTDS